MKTRFFLPILTASLLLAPPMARAADVAKGTSDIVPTQKRQTTIDAAERLTKAPTPAPLPADLPQPFSPVDFEKPDPDELKAIQAAGGRATPAGGSATPAATPSGPTTDRETLEVLASRIPSTGTIMLPGGRPLLIVGKNRIEIGAKFTVTYNNQDYELELVAIDRTTFTLRYRSEEVTRPIRTR
jgi:hypothetical protein